MTHFDVFNGDADGICALQQLRLHHPIAGKLVTGVKRDIKLLERVRAVRGDEVTVLDVSLDKNLKVLQELLDKGVVISYFDHHFAADVPVHPGLNASIDPSSETCTSIIVDASLGGAQRPWAVVGAFGDNLEAGARRLALSLHLAEEQVNALRELGVLLNYNAYGIAEEDLYAAPAELYRNLRPYTDPLEYIRESELFLRLRAGYAQDMDQVCRLTPEFATGSHALYILPAERWANRVSGVFGNQLATRKPERAHALLTVLVGGGYRVSARAPLVNKNGADELCRRFPTGGGRRAAAGINHLPEDLYDEFVACFRDAFRG